MSDGREMLVPSIFLSYDPKMHMSINLEKGLWQCFKTGNRGNFISLYANLEQISYKEAYRKFLVDEFLAEEKKVCVEKYKRRGEAYEKMEDSFKDFKPINYDNPQSEVEKLAWNFLYNRGLLTEFNPITEQTDMTRIQYFYCETGTYGGRIIIPFYRGVTDGSELPYYFQARSVMGQEPRYLNYKGFRSSSVLYPFNPEKEMICITEGVIDCMSIIQSGLNATTTLSNAASKEQLIQLADKPRKIVVCYDNDAAGLQGLIRFEETRCSLRLDPIFYCFPPKPYKDWNEMFCALGKEALHELRSFIVTQLKPFDSFEFDARQQLKTLAL